MANIRARRFDFRNYYGGALGKARGVASVVAAVGLFGIVAAGLERIYIDRVHAHRQAVPCFMEFCTVTREAGRNEVFLPAWHYAPVVRFKYEVNGTVYTGDQISSRAKSLVSKSEAEAFLGKYGPGAMTECYIDPDQPASAMLMLPHDGNVMLWLKFGVLIFLAGLGALTVLHMVTMVETRPRTLLRQPRAPGWGEIDSGPQDPLSRTRGILRDHLDR